MPPIKQEGPELKKLRSLCKKWGGQLVELSEVDFDYLNEDTDFHNAPFSNNNLGVLWKKQTIAYTGVPIWAELTHELGHVFVGRKDPEDDTDEFDFFGWEYQLVKFIKADTTVWLAQNKNYVVANYGDELGMLKPAEQQAIIEERVAHGKKLGIITTKGVPLPLDLDVRLELRKLTSHREVTADWDHP